MQVDLHVAILGRCGWLKERKIKMKSKIRKMIKRKIKSMSKMAHRGWS